MFGYLQPCKNEMKVREYTLYKSVYCGLCRHLGKDYGIISRLTLSYDCTMLTMLSLAVNNEKSCVTKGRCVCNPLKKCLYCNSDDKSFRFGGAVSVIMTYYKLEDTIEDSKFPKKIFAYILKFFISHTHKKASKEYPLIEKNVIEMMKCQKAAEKADSGIDKAADSSAKLISELCKMLSDDEKNQRILGVFGYFVGRWIYLMDAADDFEKDIKSGSFNPFKRYYKSDIKELMLYCNDALNMTMSQLIAAYNLLDLYAYRGILDNIVYKGLAQKQKKCLFYKYNKKDKSKKEDYYSVLSGKE